MGSLDLKRKYIRSLVVEELSKSENFKCFASASKRLAAGDLPAVKVMTLESKEEYLGGPPPCYSCNTTVLISIASGDKDPENNLDELANEVHERISNLLRSGDLQQLRRFKTESEFKEGGGEVIGNLSIWYELSYMVVEQVRTEELPQYKGTKAVFGEANE